MFEVWCNGHREHVLMGMGNIVGIHNTADGPVLTWRCTCGTEGSWHAHGDHHQLANAAA